MNFCVIHQPSPGPARSPFRVVEQPSQHEVDWVNRFLDRECIRRVSNATLRTYANDLLHFLRWWASVHHTGEVTADVLSDSTLLDYVRFQASQEPQLSGSAINQRIAVADRALRAMFPEAPRQVASGFQVSYWRRTPMGMGRQRPALSRLRVKTPKRVIVPLSVDEVARFWASFRTSRDLAIVGLMLLEGLRFQEVLDLNREDLWLPEAQIRVRGKGAKTRLLPLAPEAIRLLDYYLRIERPDPSAAALFVVPERPRAGRAHDARGTAIAVPLSSPKLRCHTCQPSPVSAHVRVRYGARRGQSARTHETDGPRPHSNHDGVS